MGQALVGVYALARAVLLYEYNSMAESECQAHFLLTVEGRFSAYQEKPPQANTPLKMQGAFSVAVLPVVCYAYSIFRQSGLVIEETIMSQKYPFLIAYVVFFVLNLVVDFILGIIGAYILPNAYAV